MLRVVVQGFFGAVCGLCVGLALAAYWVPAAVAHWAVVGSVAVFAVLGAVVGERVWGWVADWMA